MDYEQFRFDFTDYMMKKFNVAGAPERVRLLLQGYASDDEQELAAIRETNLKYYGDADNILRGDTLFIKLDIRSEDTFNAVRVNIRNMYDRYLAKGWDAVYEDVDAMLYQQSLTDSSVIDNLPDYEGSKEKLVVTLRNAGNKRISSRSHICARKDDFAFVLYVIAGVSKDGCRVVAPVPRILAKDWTVSDDEAIQAALKNTERLTSVFVAPGKAYIGSQQETLIPFNSDEDITRVIERMGIPDEVCLRTEPRGDGAIALFFNGMLERLAKLFGGDFLVAPINEDYMILHRAGTIRPENIRNGLSRSNRANPENMLSENAYYYDAGKRRLKKR